MVAPQAADGVSVTSASLAPVSTIGAFSLSSILKPHRIAPSGSRVSSTIGTDSKDSSESPLPVRGDGASGVSSMVAEVETPVFVDDAPIRRPADSLAHDLVVWLHSAP